MCNESKINIISSTFKIKKEDYLSNGDIPIISQDNTYISGYTNLADKKLNKDKYVCFGDHTEIVKFVDFQFAQGADGLKIFTTNNLNIKFLYYLIINFYKKHNNYERHFKYLQKTLFPIPPLKIQDKIVNVLDNFEKLVNDLSNGLPAEIKARQQQYEFYRDYLLNFERKTDN